MTFFPLIRSTSSWWSSSSYPSSTNIIKIRTWSRRPLSLLLCQVLKLDFPDPELQPPLPPVSSLSLSNLLPLVPQQNQAQETPHRRYYPKLCFSKVPFYRHTLLPTSSPLSVWYHFRILSPLPSFLTHLSPGLKSCPVSFKTGTTTCHKLVYNGESSWGVVSPCSTDYDYRGIRVSDRLSLNGPRTGATIRPSPGVSRRRPRVSRYGGGCRPREFLVDSKCVGTMVVTIDERPDPPRTLYDSHFS